MDYVREKIVPWDWKAVDNHVLSLGTDNIMGVIFFVYHHHHHNHRHQHHYGHHHRPRIIFIDKYAKVTFFDIFMSLR